MVYYFIMPEKAKIIEIDEAHHHVHFTDDGAFRNEATIQYVDVSRDDTILPGKGTIQHTEKYITSIENKRRQVMSLPSDESGLEIQRIENFRQLIGAPKKLICYLGGVSYHRALDVYDTPYSESEGVYEGHLDHAIVKRNDELEIMNGPGITEAFAIHEIAHSSSSASPVQAVHYLRRGLFRKNTGFNFFRSRTGFMTTDVHNRTFGHTLEEAYADLERGLYVQSANLTPQLTRGANNYDDVMSGPIPDHYMYKVGTLSESNLTFATSSISATILEILIDHDQELLDSLRISRHDSSELLLVADRMDYLMPGLYDKMKSKSDMVSNALLLKQVLRRFKHKRI
jgi:hypothetical protein